jgi:hypothetical protein
MKRTSFLAAVAALSLAACSEKSGPGPLTSHEASTLPGVQEVWVHVTKVRAHSVEGGWTDLSTTPVDVNLLAIADAGVDLGFANLPAGTVTQLRLVVEPEGNHLVVEGGAEVPLVVPSGSTSGIKIHGPWTIDSCEETTVTLELDGHKSIWAHGTGSGDEWTLRPVIRTVAEQGPGTCEPEGTCVPTACPSGLCDDAGVACAPGGANAPCSTDAECLSNVCSEGYCAPGAESSPCRVPEDCATGLACTAGVCATAGGPAL